MNNRILVTVLLIIFMVTIASAIIFLPKILNNINETVEPEIVSNNLNENEV